MQLLLIKTNLITRFNIPSKMTGSFWLTDLDKYENERNLINVNLSEAGIILKGNPETKILVNNSPVDSVVLNKNEFCLIKNSAELESFIVFFSPSFDNTFTCFDVKAPGNFYIGTADDCNIRVKLPLIADKQSVLKYDGSNWIFENLYAKCNAYINDKKENSKVLKFGDTIFIMGLKLIPLKNRIIINNVNSTLALSPNYFIKREIEVHDEEISGLPTDEAIYLYDEKDYFLSSPRFKTSLVKEKVSVDSPPAKEEEKETPLIYTLGPMFTMGISSAVTGFMAVSSVMNNKMPLSSAMPTLVISGAMLCTMILWPLLMKSFEKKEKKRKEGNRQDRYITYLRTKRKRIEYLKQVQRQILLETNLSLADCQNIILMRKRNLWERKIEHDDFASVRIGEGNVQLEVELSYSEEHFALEDDNLREELNNLIKASEEVPAVPVSFPLTKKNNVVVIGEQRFQKRFIKNTVLQLMTFHSYEDMKFIFMIENDEDELWNTLKILPHAWDNEKETRFFAKNYDEMSKLSFYLESILNTRKFKEENGKRVQVEGNFKDYSPYYVIFVNNIKKTRNIGIISEILESKSNYGFSVVILNDGISNLPKECSNFIALEEEKCAIMENDLNTEKQQLFKMDNDETIDIYKCCYKLANIPVVFTKQNQTMPNSVSFLEMYGLGNVEQFNSINRWSKNNPTNSLTAPIGFHKDGELFNLDLHEKFYGPHGLVAGMTGSGKSEFIITYILSMAVNFHPEDVSFVLIDYKGGGLAGAFENKDLGIKLPHLAGTITNLDTIELKRSLVSIQSELRRRQTLFNKARDELNESTIDIYKYQKLCKDGMDLEPISHLFIISDEFAELKSQQPDFMDQLISTARIGRSLGVHLILCTQKPSGVVNDQIWSNSKFRVCLKVQEKSDSMEVIKSPDAASLKNPGRFYLQVGYNDFYGMGQAAWAGEQYYPTDQLKKKIDTSLSFINNMGEIVKSVDDIKKQELLSMGDELSNIVKYLSDIAISENIDIRKLWLDKIPEMIYINDLKEKYNYRSQNHVINPIIGEYDDPGNQKQGLLTLNLTEGGNAIIYGVSGSGTELALTSLIYSSIIEHNSKEVNFYILDFGAETFRVFKQAPQVGDIVFVNDEEKVNNIFRYLSEEMQKRKQILANAGVSIEEYNRTAETPMPLIVTVINNYEVFSEVYEKHIDSLQILSREASRYGIAFVLSANGASSIRYKVAQSYPQQLVLQFNDDVDYVTLLGNVQGIYPSKLYGRGILRIEKDIFEFQVAHPYRKENLNEYIRIVCEKLDNGQEFKAKGIAILPPVVNWEVVKDYTKDTSSIPIGVDKNTLEVINYNFKENYSTIICAQDYSSFDKFVPSLIQVLTSDQNSNIIVIDSDSLYKDNKFTGIGYYNNNFEELISKLSNTVKQYKESQNQNYKNMICLIIGIDSLRNKIQNKELLYNALEEGMETEKINIVLIDTQDRYKPLEYENFYKKTVRNTYGIWIGPGLSEQFVIKVNGSSSISRTISSSEFAFVISKSEVVSTIKLIDFINKGE